MRRPVSLAEAGRCAMYDRHMLPNLLLTLLDGVILVIATLRKSVKNLADAKEEFEKGGRQDLAAANAAEIQLLEKYLPQPLDPVRVEAIVAEVIRSTGATTKKEMGKVMAALKQRPEADLIDFGAASKIIQGKLA